jgi:hypothetical protein
MFTKPEITQTRIPLFVMIKAEMSMFNTLKIKASASNTGRNITRTDHLKEEGVMTAINHNCIGIWKFYSKTGKLDSVLDYDKKYRISYFKALEIAAKKNLMLPDIEVTLEKKNATTVWRVLRWKESENHNGQASEGIDINAETGRVSKAPNIIITY